MRKMNKRALRPTPALVVAFVALFAAMGGFGYAAVKMKANSVKTRNLRDAAVTTGKIADGAVTTPKLAPDAVAPKATNAVNAMNAANAMNAVQVAANTFADATASCDAGDRVIGGGYAWLNDAGTDHLMNANTGNVTSSDVTFSTPNRSDNTFGDNPDQWIVRARSNVDNDLFAWAVCLRA